MTKAMLQKSNEIFIHSCEILIRENAAYQEMMENCTIMPREYYKELIEHVQELQKQYDDLFAMVGNVGVHCIAGTCTDRIKELESYNGRVEKIRGYGE